jgi:small ligand-binding sensory domain FIST
LCARDNYQWRERDVCGVRDNYQWRDRDVSGVSGIIISGVRGMSVVCQGKLSVT